VQRVVAKPGQNGKHWVRVELDGRNERSLKVEYSA
jgi:hypothetical protein